MLTHFTHRTKAITTTLLHNADITWDRNGLPRARTFDDIYFSVNNPLEESRHVFIAGNKLPERLPLVGSKTFVIGECGFGFGLNFLLTVDTFSRLAPASSRLHYISCELHPVRLRDLKRYYAKLPSSLLNLAAVLLGHYPEQGKGLHRFQFSYRQRYFTLDLVYEDATRALRGLSMPAPGVDAWYLDGFAPSRNDAMWQPRLFKTMASLSHAGTTLASYSVAGSVRRNLEGAGFSIEKSPGFGNKRHMLSGILHNAQAQAPGGWTCPWPQQPTDVEHVAVIGGGLAGCATAQALAARGINVTLVEQAEHVAAGSSGNPRGIVHFSPARQLTPAARFRLQAYTHALKHYAVLATRHDIGWDAGGVLQLAVSDKEQQQLQALVDSRCYDPSLLQWLSRNQAQAIAGVPLPAGGLFLPTAGSVYPGALCRAWSAATGVQCQTRTTVTGLRKTGNHWQLALEGPGGRNEAGFDAVVLCTNPFTRTFDIIPDYPLVANHGQTDTYMVTDNAELPQTVICHKGYAVAWKHLNSRMLMTGGSYAQGPQPLSDETALGKKNLELLQAILPDLATALRSTDYPRRSRTGTRVTTPDYLPLAGPVENVSACRDIYAALARNARKTVAENPHYLDGLFINMAHGSSGLCTVPLLADYLASLICGESLPLLREDIQAIHPMRFLVRDLKKQKRH